MYKKRLAHFQFERSIKSSIKNKQEARFKRKCRRIFTMDNNKPARTLKQQLLTGKRHRFLFLQLQLIDKSIQHLRYTQQTKSIKKQDYNFKVPFFSLKLTIKAKVCSPTNPSKASTSHNHSLMDSGSTSNPTDKVISSDPLFLPISANPYAFKNIYPLPPNMDLADSYEVPDFIRP
ncbi:uncharacterized protein OCT59_015525 [Rhizophagus irregularis]|uniref:DUF8211 domain-containing protein n=4 Tax=Rhizophagus irregularis TaxID=588596 RepID=U9T0K4_RHIID|nr:hypothetical protein OCT59_015525 [Rhizophagus irregularis]